MSLSYANPHALHGFADSRTCRSADELGADACSSFSQWVGPGSHYSLNPGAKKGGLLRQRELSTHNAIPTRLPSISNCSHSCRMIRSSQSLRAKPLSILGDISFAASVLKPLAAADPNNCRLSLFSYTPALSPKFDTYYVRAYNRTDEYHAICE